MIKFLLKTVLIAAIAYFTQPYMPWWVIMVIAFALNLLIKTKGTGAFLSSFLGIGVLWFVQTMIIHNVTDNILTSKMAAILPLGGNAIALIILTAFIGGLAAGLAGYTGNACRNLLIRPDKKKQKNSRYGRPDYMYR